MTLAEQFASELQREAQTTRRVLERLPEGQLSWKPHAKSMSTGELAMHIAGLPYGIAELLHELVTELPDVPVREATSVDEVLTTLDQSVAFATQRLATWGDAGLQEMWRLTREGATLFEVPRAAMVRELMLSHWFHHRGQLTVYLRMLDVPLPSVYGPTADENPLA